MLVIVTVWNALVVPTVCAAKLRRAGAATIEVAIFPETVNRLVWAITALVIGSEILKKFAGAPVTGSVKGLPMIG